MADDFASLMNAGGGDRAARRLRKGETAEGTVVAVTVDTVFLDVGAVADARVPREDCVDASGRLTVQVGDTLRGVVAEPDRGEGAVITLAVGRVQADASSLETALEAGLPVEGRVTGVNKGGIEVDVGGLRCFCPASQVDVGRVEDLGALIGQTLRFKVAEVRDARSVVLSRRALLEEERRAQGLQRLESLKVGSDVEGTVTTVQRYGAFVDIDGIEGLLHISQLAARRVESVEDVVTVGERVKVRVIAIEPSADGPRVSLSLRALQEGDAPPAPRPDEVLEARVVEHKQSGVVVETAKGPGFVHVRDLDLPPRGDHRRGYPVDAVLKVVAKPGAGRGGRLAFSMRGVAAVEERANVAEHAARAAGRGTKGKVGTFGALLAEKLGVSPSSVSEPDEPPGPEAAQAPPAKEAGPARPSTPSADGMASLMGPPKAGDRGADASRRGEPPRERRADPPGVVRRKR
jgi:small subunit ribosomal protein S1